MKRATFALLATTALAAACASSPETSETADASPTAVATPVSYPAVQDEAAFRGLYKELIEINTTASEGSCTDAANAMKARLSAAGYPDEDLIVIANPDWPQGGNLIATLPGTETTKKPILLLAHIDVVEANPADWERDPFTLTEEDGYFYARGAIDDKAMAAIWVDAFIRYRQEGYTPTQTLKIALTCGEEGVHERVAADWLLKNHRELVDAEFVLNEGAGGRIDSETGEYSYNGVQAGEKLYQDYKLEITNPGGHSSRPQKDNAIYRLSNALIAVSEMDFPIQFNDATRTFFMRMSDITADGFGPAMQDAVTSQDPEAIEKLKTDPTYNALLHTTCVGTMVTAGHAPNALPQRATANVNCRIFPGNSPEDTRVELEKAIGDEGIAVTFADSPETIAPAPELTPEIMGPIEALTEEMFPGIPVVPAMATGATDGRFFNAAGIPTYGVSGIFSDSATSNAHGLNERVAVKSLMEGREFLYRLVKAYAD